MHLLAKQSPVGVGPDQGFKGFPFVGGMEIFTKIQGNA